MRGPVDSGREDGGDRDGSQPDACDADDCGDDAHCEGTRCVCDDGFAGDGVNCSPFDSCTSSDDCGDDAECVAGSGGGGKSCACNDGFTGDGMSCTQLGCGSLICDPNASCAGETTQCECANGFTGDGEACGDVNECEGDDFECADNAECVNTFGGYGCECEGPYGGNGKTSCRPLCEIALEDRDVCAAFGLCRVDGSGALCDACAPGFEGSGKNCTASSDCGALCDGAGSDDADNAVCAGGDNCECAPGYEGEPASGCEDIDECAVDDRCGDNASCENLPGGHFCECEAGYAKNDDGACVDENECEAEVSPCHPNATCTNTTSSFSCACKDGYTGDGSSCRDVNECAEDDACATCTNTAGSYSCECPSGLTGESGDCYCDLSGMWAMRQDVDTCWEDLYIPGAPEDPLQALISAGESEATVWELHKLVYDGDKIVVEKKGCGAEGDPDLTSAYFKETYSSYVPISVFDELDLVRGNDINEPGIVPGTMFTTDEEAAVVGIDLGDDPRNADWPASYTEVNDEGDDAPAWSDTEGDGQPGMTAWPKLPTQTVPDGSGRHYSYLPAAINIDFQVSGRAGCVSLAARTITRMEVDVESCTHMVGSVIDVETKGRVQGCTLIDVPTPGAEDDPEDYDPITCNADDWDNQESCTPLELDKLDADENQDQTSNVQFELVRVGDIDDDVTCADVRERLPAFERRTPTITCRD